MAFKLRCSVSEVVTVKCGYYPDADTDAGFDPHPLRAEYHLMLGGESAEISAPPEEGTVFAGVVVFTVPVLVLLCAWLGSR